MVGSRSVPASLYQQLKTELDHFVSQYTNMIIISGGARGADTLAREYARERNLPFEEYPAKWEIYGKSAGYKRNAEMVKEADALIAIWDGESKGTQHSIQLAEKKAIPIHIIRF